MESLKELARSIFEQALAECSIERSFDRVMQVASGCRVIELAQVVVGPSTTALVTA